MTPLGSGPPPNNLPDLLDDFIGREEELSAVSGRFQGAGLDGVVQKPVRKASLLATIQAAIERKANS